MTSSNRTINEYVRVVEAFRENGKVKHGVVADLGRKDVLVQELLPNSDAYWLGTKLSTPLNCPIPASWIHRPGGPSYAVRTLFDQLSLWKILDESLRRSRDIPFADREFVLVANRLVRSSSEHRIAGWLEPDFVCDRKGRRFVPKWHQHRRVRVHSSQLEAWYRTLDQLHRAKERIEVALYHLLRDLFSFKPCSGPLRHHQHLLQEGLQPAEFAKHGHSRDGKPHNVQVVVGVVMVAGWPIAHHG